MYKPFKTVLSRIRFYIFLMGVFLGIEIPLGIFTYFKIFPHYRNYVWLFTILIGVATAVIVHYMIRGIIDEDYRVKLLFDTNEYDTDENIMNENITNEDVTNTNTANENAANENVENGVLDEKA